MSNPSSKLSAYRSYSYHHVLLMCDSTETADALMYSTSSGVWSHPAEDAGELGRFSPKSVPNNEKLKYCVIVNGATDAAFVINSARWSATTAGDATPQDRNTSVAIEGTLDILEPKGIVFMDQMVKCCNALNINSGDAVYLLKTFFVGYGYDEAQGDYVDYISDIPPIQMSIIDITGSFTEQGGIYHLSFVSISGGASRLPQYSRLPSSLTFTAGATLGSTLRTLEAKIQAMYQPYFNCVRSQLSAAITAAGKDPTKALAALRPVTYKVSYDCEYENYTVTNQAQLSKNEPGCSAPATITTVANSSIEDAIHAIMSSSREVANDMAKGVGGDVKYEYKIHAIMERSEAGTTVTYHVGRFMRPKDAAKLPDFEYMTNYDKGTASDPILNTAIRRNIIEFDYIYTGKNIDILEFEMTMAQGLQYMQIATAANTFRDQLDSVPPVHVVTETQGQANMSWSGKITPIPVFFGSKLSLPRDRNSQDPVNTVQAAYTMTKHSSIEVAGEATMRIVGNTNFLGGINRYSSPKFHKDRILAQKKKCGTTGSSNDDTPVTEDTVMTDFGVTPSFAHINIKMPRLNDDIALFTRTTGEGESSDYAVDFWFDGYYYILGVESIFENGEFTQTLHMIGLPRSDIANTDGTMETDNEIDLTQRVTDCYNGNVGCGQPSTGSGSPSTSVPSGKVENGQQTNQPPAPTTTADANTVNSKVTSPSDVKGWDKAKPAIKDSITNAAAATGTSATTLAQMAAIESNLGAATMNPTSSARGTFQIVEKTWNGTVNSGAVPGVPPGTSFAEANNPEANAAVAATLMVQNQKSLMKVTGAATPADVSPGDTYLAHFLGVGGAQAVISADNKGQSSMTVRDAYIQKFGEKRGAQLYDQQAAANSSILKPTTTVGEIRAKAAASMASSVPLASVKIAGTAPATPSAPSTSVNTAPTTTRPVSAAVAATRDCKAEEAKAQTPSKSSCDQSKPEPDKK